MAGAAVTRSRAEGVIFLPITDKRASSTGGLQVTVRLTGPGVDAAALRKSLKQWASGGAAVGAPGSAAPAGRVVDVGDNELTLKVTDSGACKLLDENIYRGVGIGVCDTKVMNSKLIDIGQVTEVVLLDRADAPNGIKRAGVVQYVDSEIAQLHDFATSHPEPNVRAWATTQLEAIDIRKAASATGNVVSEWAAERRIGKLLGRS